MEWISKFEEYGMSFRKEAGCWKGFGHLQQAYHGTVGIYLEGSTEPMENVTKSLLYNSC